MRDVILGLRTERDGGIEHVAFDLDGTLVDSAADLAAALNHVLRARGAPAIDPARVRRFVGHGAPALIARAVGPLPEAEAAAALAIFLEYYAAHCVDETRMYPGIDGVLDALGAAGIPMSIVTNKPRALAERIVGELGLRSRFAALVGGDTLPLRKPDPAGLCRVAAATGAAVSRTVLVGDSPVDLETARGAGAMFVGVLWGFDPDGLLAYASTPVAHNAGELLALLGVRRAGGSTPLGRAARVPPS